MMLLEPTAYLKGSPRAMINWSRMVGTLYAQAEMNTQRFLLTDLYATPSITFVRSLLDRISEPYFLSTEDQFDLYRQYVLPESRTIARIIDPMSGANYTSRHFVEGNITKEIMLPTSGIIGAGTNYLYSNWEFWEDIAPIKLMSHDSDELNLRFHGGQITFLRDKPTQIVFAVDVAALLWKFILYMKNENLTFENVDRDLFITKYVLPYFYKDLVDIWLTRLILSRFDAQEVLDDVFAMDVSNNSFVGISTIKSATQELDDMISLLGQNKISIGTFLNSAMFGRDTLMDRIELYSSTYVMENTPRYTGFELLKSVDLIGVMLGVLSSQVKFRTVTKLVRDLQLERNSIARSHWDSHFRDKSLGYKVHNLLDMVDTTLISASLQ